MGFDHAFWPQQRHAHGERGLKDRMVGFEFSNGDENVGVNGHRRVLLATQHQHGLQTPEVAGMAYPFAS
jgi:hypothetical protein